MKIKIRRRTLWVDGPPTWVVFCGGKEVAFRDRWEDALAEAGLHARNCTMWDEINRATGGAR